MACEEEQCGFRQGRGCMGQGLLYLANGKDVFWALMDLVKAYDMIYRHGMW